MKISRPVAVIASAAAALALFAGCSSKSESGAEPPKTDSAQSAEPSATPTTGSSTYTKIKDPAGSVKGYVGALKDAEVKTCDNDGDLLKVGGTVTNPTKKAQQYRIYVSAMSPDDTRGIVQVDIPSVAGGATQEWKTQFELPDTDLQCVLRVERFDPQK